MSFAGLSRGGSLPCGASIASRFFSVGLFTKVEQIAEAVARLPPDQLARFRRWFSAFEAGRTNHAEELDSSATKLGRLAGRALLN
jgi:hypothetical protein